MADRKQTRRDALTSEEALAAINQLRCNVIGTQEAGWSNLVYPLVAILNEAGYEYAAPSDEAFREHLMAYGGAGGWPGRLHGE